MSFRQHVVHFLRQPVGWAAALGLALINIPIEIEFQQSGLYLSYWTYLLANEIVGLVCYMAFALLLFRRLMRGRLELGPPRWSIWVSAMLILSIARIAVVLALLVLSYVLVPDLMLILAPEWHEFALEVLISPLLLGFYIWEIALVLGRFSPPLKRAHSFVFVERRWVFLLYFLISISDFPLSYAIAQLSAEWSAPAVSVAFSIRYAIYSWILSLISLALFCDFLESDERIEDVFA